MVQGVETKDGYLINTNPSTGEKTAKVKCTTEDEADAALANAKAALADWRLQTLQERIACLKQGLGAVHQLSETFAKLIVQEMGKTIGEAEEEMKGTVEKDEFLAILEDALKPQTFGKSKIVRHAIGVVVILSPWNFPVDEILLLALPALASGNTVIVKPSEVVPQTGALLVKQMQTALPPNVMQVVQGDGVIGRYLVQHDNVDMIAMTGSSATGRKILADAAPKMKRVVLEMGGKDAMIVFDDADLKKAAKDAVANSLCNAGQVCCAIERVYVAEQVYDAFQELACEYAEAYTVGDGMDRSNKVGPLVSAMQYQHCKKHVDNAMDEGGMIQFMSPMPGPSDGNFFPVMVLTHLTHDMLVMTQETFGPIVAIAKFDNTEDQAVEFANNTEYGLGSSVYTADLDKAKRVASRIDAGQVGINCYALDNMDVNCPWVGHKHSGFGYHSGIDGFRQFSLPKTMVFDEEE